MPAIDPKLMALIQGGAGRTGPAAASGPPAPDMGTGPAPGGAPMTTPQPAAGDRQDGMVIVSLAGDLLEQALGKVGHETEDGRVILDVLGKLSKAFGHTKPKSQELMPAELMQLMQSIPQAGAMSPAAKAMGQHPMPVPGMQPMGMAA